MEGQNKKLESKEIKEVHAPILGEAISEEIPETLIPEESEEVLKEPEEVLKEPEEVLKESEEIPEELDEEYFEGDYVKEEYPKEDLESDEDWESEAGGSEIPELGGIYGLFRDVLKKKDSKKVSNLTKEELGIWNLSVRDCERIALISRTFHHFGVAKFFESQSRIITDTAMSKEGWFTELFITSKRYASRDTSSVISNLPQFKKKSKWRVFSEKESQPIQEPVQ